MAQSTSSKNQTKVTDWQLFNAYEGNGHSLLDMLWNALLGYRADTSEFGQDMQNKFMDMLLSQQEKKEDREYNEAWRDNERAYSSAQAQLARLMATGMSRDAAMQLLGSGGAAGGSGSAAPVSSTLPFGQNPSAMNQRALDIENRNSWANIVLGSLNTAANIASLGFSGANVMKQMRFTGTQDDVLTKGTQAVGLSSDVIGAVNSAIQAGASFSDKDTKTPQDFNKWINDNVSSYPQLQPAQQIISSNGNGNPFFQRELSTAFKDWHEQRTKPSMLTETLNSVIADNLIKDLNVDLILAETQSAQANAALLLQEFENSKIEFNNLISAGEKLDAERRLIESQITLTDAQATSQGLQNDITSPLAKAYKFNESALTATYQMQIAVDVMKWSTMSRDDVMQDMKNKIIQDEKYGAALATFNACTQTSLNSWTQENTQMAKTALAFKYYNMGDIMRAIAESLPKIGQDPVGYLFNATPNSVVNRDVREMILDSFLPSPSIDLRR